MPFAIWSIAVGLLAGPPLLWVRLLPATGDSRSAAVTILSGITLASWALGAALLRHYGKWPWGPDGPASG